MKLSELTQAQLQDALGGDGLYLHIGPFIVRLRSPIPEISQRLGLMYPDAPVFTEPGFADFHIALRAPGLRRWFRPQVLFYFDHLVPFKPLPLAHAYPLLEWGLNWCIAKYAQQYLMFHAAVLEKNGKAFLFPGPPGSGKSTLCAALSRRGWRLLSDEMALLDPQRLDLAPLPRPVALKNDSIDILRAFDPQAVIGPSSHDTSKGTVAHMRPTRESMEQRDRPAYPAFVVQPRYTAGSGLQLEALEKANAFLHLINNSFNYNILREKGFEATCALMDRCECYELTYSSLEEAIQALDALAMEGGV